MFTFGLSEDLSEILIPTLLLNAPAFMIVAGVLLYRRKAVVKGHCALCGYDLTANISGVCPECGSLIG